MNKPPWQSSSILVAGCGSIGRRHARVLHSLGVTDIRVCDPLAEQRKLLTSETSVTGEFDTFQQGLDSTPNAVYICTPPKMHVPMAIQAIHAGCHVFSEKPVSDSLAGVDDLAELIEKSGKRFMVGLCFRYHEGLTKAKTYLDQGRIGRLVSMRLRMGEHLPEVRPDYRSLFTLKESGAFDLSHEIDLACWFAGDQEIREVRAVSGPYSDLGFTAPDVAEVLIRFGDRCLASVHLDFFSHPRQRQTELLGTTGTITVKFPTWDACTVAVYEASRKKWETEEIPTERDFMFRSESEELLRAITEGAPIRSTLAEGRKSLQIISEAQRQ